MDSNLYNGIISEFLIPFVVSTYGLKNFFLQQDNDPKHSSKICSKFLRENKITWVNNIKLYISFFL